MGAVLNHLGAPVEDLLILLISRVLEVNASSDQSLLNRLELLLGPALLVLQHGWEENSREIDGWDFLISSFLGWPILLIILLLRTGQKLTCWKPQLLLLRKLRTTILPLSEPLCGLIGKRAQQGVSHLQGRFKLQHCNRKYMKFVEILTETSRIRLCYTFLTIPSIDDVLFSWRLGG